MMERRTFLELTGVTLTAPAAMARTASAQRALPKSEYDYIDWSWERWRRITRATRPRIVTEQTGKAELIDLLTHSGEKVTTPEQWLAQRATIKRVLKVFLGEPPKTKPPLRRQLLLQRRSQLPR